MRVCVESYLLSAILTVITIWAFFDSAVVLMASKGAKPEKLHGATLSISPRNFVQLHKCVFPLLVAYRNKTEKKQKYGMT